MEKQILKNLLDKFYAGSISEDEKKQLNNWYKSSENDEGYTYRLTVEEKTEMENSILKVINTKIEASETIIIKENTEKFLFKFKSNSINLSNLKFAAVFFMAIMAAALAYIFLNQTSISHSTGYGQISHIILPDHSSVILNGNSTLKYKDNWRKNEVREVILDGEAFFSVSHIKNEQKFLVHTSDGFHVEVLGTEFTVSKRPHKTRVTLNSGKIELNIKDKKKNERVIMKPGELVEFEDDPLHYVRKNVNPEVYSSWKNKKLVLDRTSLRELLTMVQDCYGLKLKVVDEDLLDQKISGNIPAEDIETLVRDISAIYKVKFKNYKNQNQN